MWNPFARKEQTTEQLWTAGSRLLEANQPALAADVLQKAYEQEPSRLLGRLNLGAALFLTGKYPEAIGHLRYVLALEPQNTPALMNLAACLDALGKSEESIATLEKVVAARPEWKDAHFNLAVAYHKQEMNDKAVDALKAELRINPANKNAQDLLHKLTQ
jgi:tetratricopeptide (TPR) repeat protein